MITDFLLDFGFSIFNFFWGLLPAWQWTMPPGLGVVLGECHRWNWVAPVSELGVVLSLTTTIFTALWGWKVVKQLIDWVTALIP